MNTTYYLAVDIGASSGRHMLGSLQNGRLVLEEIYRFPNRMQKQNGHLVWDVEALFREIKTGLRLCREKGKIPSYMGIDTWGVDFVLIDKEGAPVGDAVAYRDSRTQGIDEEVYHRISEKELYRRTGIQKQIFNTVYQLAALSKTDPAQLDRADAFLMIPDYLSFCLTGIRANEYTNATTTQLVNAKTFDWDYPIIDSIGVPRRLFRRLRHAGSYLGPVLPEIAEEIGYPLTVMLPPTHDTASAVLAVPLEEGGIYLSSGTWSLLGIERRKPDLSTAARTHNFTNEGGYASRFRFLKNIMGLWMIQSIKKELGTYSFSELSALAREGSPRPIDVNDDAFLSPASMIDAVQAATGEPGLSLPDLLATVYHGLADCYARSVREIEELTGERYDRIYIVGGGSKDEDLSSLTAEKSGKTVCTGIVEATAIGNLLAQMLGQGEIVGISAAREIVRRSFALCEIAPPGEQRNP